MMLSFFLLSYTLCVSHSSTDVTVTLTDTIINTTSEDFVSTTVDSYQLFENWTPQILLDPNTAFLLSQLSPGILRVGGTQADYTYYDVGSPSPCDNLPSGYHCLNTSLFNDIVKLANNVGLKLVFGLSAGYPEYPDENTPSWNYTNTQNLLQYIHDEFGYDSSQIHGFELGNEVNSDVQWEFQSDAFYTLYKLLQQIWGDDRGGFMLAGCDPHSYTLREPDTDRRWTFLVNWIENTCDIVNAANYHSYVNQNTSAIFTYDGINEQYKESERFSTIFTGEYFKNGSASENCMDLKNHQWAGEIAEYNNGGIEGATDTYWDGFWYLDALGSLANLGTEVFARQTFAHSTYGLLNSNNPPSPNPDYWTAVLFNMLVSENVLGITSSNDLFRAYAFCTNGVSGSVTMAFINLLTESVNLKYDTSLLNNDSIDLYILQGDSSSDPVFSAGVLLNGNELKYNNDQQMPNLDPKVITDGNVDLPEQSYGFIVFPSTSLNSC